MGDLPATEQIGPGLVRIGDVYLMACLYCCAKDRLLVSLIKETFRCSACGREGTIEEMLSI